MKKIIYTLILPLIIFVGCHSNSGHNHEHCDHNHEHHNHDHSHDHDNHQHDCENDHSHDHDEEAAHDHDHADGIIFSSEQARAIGLTTEKIVTGDFSQVIKTSGQLLAAPNDEVLITASMAGGVFFEKTNLYEGISVQKGELLVVVSARNTEDGDPAQKARVRYEVAKKDFDRAQKLQKDRLISEKDYNEMRLAYEEARLAFQLFADQKQSEGAAIKSPITGVITRKFIDAGDYVTVGQPLFSVAANRQMTLCADVAVRYYPTLGKIHSANFKLSHDDTVYRLSDMGGRIASFGKSVANQALVPLYFEFDHKERFPSGTYAEVYLLGEVRQGVISVPVTALVEEQGLFFVYKQVCVDIFQRQEVKTGESNGERIEIVTGLKTGDIVVTQGAYHIKLASASTEVPHGHEH